MSTRSTTHFTYKGTTMAIVYRHSDGYPEGAGTDLYRFLQEVNDTVKDQRFNDPSYLAAKYVVWLAGQFHHGGSPLEFLSVGVLQKDPGDIDYRYYIDCSQLVDGLPKVTCFDVESNGRNWNDPEYALVDKKECKIPRPGETLPEEDEEEDEDLN